MKKIWLWVGIVLFLGSTVTADYFYMKQLEELSQVQTTTVAAKTMKKTLVTSGKVVPANIERVYIDRSKGKIKNIFVREGDKITEGTKLFQYANGQISGQMALLELKRQRIETQINYWNDKFNQLEERIDAAENDDILKPLIPQMEGEKDHVAYQLELADYDLQEIDLQLQQLRDKEEASIVESKTSGIVMNVNENTASNGPVITIASMVYEIEGKLSEYETVAVKKGQKVTVTSKALPNKTWSGEISEVGTIPVSGDNLSAGEGQQVTLYPFSITFAEEPNQLRQGYHVKLEIVVSRHEDALVLPEGSMIIKDGKAFVYVVSDGKLERRTVNTGYENGNWTEITSGLKKGETVVLNPDKELEDGMDVTIKQSKTKKRD